MWTAAPWLTPPAPGAAVIVLDCISLHAINSEFGHAFGDRVVAETARRVQRVAGDCPVWRIGGDEFVIATQVAGINQLRRFGLGLRIATEERLDGVMVGVWMGAAIASPSSNSADELMRMADTARYHALRRRTRELVIAPDDL
jgi:diguanylate cyclase (GGDEF)-like protein